MRRFRFLALWGSTGWIEPAFVEVGDDGIIASVASHGPLEGCEVIDGWALPGVPNAHSHVFQYAMAGLAEHVPAGASGDDFWSWRETMYALALSLTPERMKAVAAHAYGEMVLHGFTSVAEFHYLHHDPHGKPYPHATEMADALCEAASDAGIRLTLVPVHYRSGDFGRGPSPRQRRFLFDGADSYLAFADKCAASARRLGHGIGGGVHSLRASPPDDTLRIFSQLPKEWPRHLHVAEQTKEVQSCVAALGKRPVEWLLDKGVLDARCHLVHATHVTDEEVRGIAAAGAHVVLCPTTEANLGDGMFPLVELRAAGGRFSVGTDSHVGIDPWEELRWADYPQRLRLGKRNPLCANGEDSGEILLQSAVANGGRAMGRSSPSFLVPGDPLDAAVVDGADPLWGKGLPPSRRIATRIFAPSRPLLGTLVGGRWICRDGRHHSAGRLADAARAALGDRGTQACASKTHS